MTLVMRALTLLDVTAATGRFARDLVIEMVRLSALRTKDRFSRRIAASNAVRARHFICRIRSQYKIFTSAVGSMQPFRVSPTDPY